MKLFLSIFLHFTAVLLWASDHKPGKPQDGKSAVLKGVLNDPMYSSIDSIDIEVYPYYFRSRFNLDALTFRVPVKKNSFEKKIEAADGFGYFRIAGPESIDIEIRQQLFLFESEDHINMNITKSGIAFSGDNSARFNCQWDVFKCSYDKWYDSLVTRRYDLDSNAYDYFVDSKLNSDFVFGKKIKLIESIMPFVDSQYYQILMYNCLGDKYNELFRIMGLGDVASEKYQEDKKAFYLNHMKNLPADTARAAVKVKSLSYCDYLFMRELIAAKYDKLAPGTDGKVTFGDIYEPIIQKYTGLLLDKLIATLFSESFGIYHFKDADLYFNQALTALNDQKYKAIVGDLGSKRATGSPAYPFSLMALDGSVVKLRDLKGKFLIIDFWFTGCTNCALLKKAMIPVVDTFRNNKDVLFLSVNVDNSRDSWVKSVRSGRYTHDGSINLSTFGEGFMHPMLKYYNYTGFPQLLLIDKDGMIFSSEPPIPVIARTDNTNKLIALVNKYLHK